MRIGKASASILVAVGLIGVGRPALAAPPADDFLNPQTAGPRLTLMPFVGPGFRANYDHRFDIEKEMSEVRTQLIGDVAVPFAEVSANVDFRFFLMTFGGSVGYHDEWHLLQFQPDPKTGRDLGGQTPLSTPLAQDRTIRFNDLDRDARAMKDQFADVQSGHWAFYEGRWGFVAPSYHFVGVSTFAARHEARPSVSYDWINGTVLNGGWHFRWEGYALFRERNWGFIGPAFRALVVPRNRVPSDYTIQSTQVVVPEDSACQAGAGIRCVERYEFEFHYGILAGIRPNWVNSSDTFLFRGYTTWGLDNKLFGTQTFRQPIQLLFAYMVDIDL
jgi:hypothetical protein